MSRVIVVIDSETGTLIDANGNGREMARYAKFAKRMLSLDKDPVLDYGANGGTKLEISKGGAAGDEINLKAKSVNISASGRESAVLKVNGKTLEQIVDQSGSGASALDRITGKDGEIDVDFVSVPSGQEGETTQVLQISLDQDVRNKLDIFESTVESLDEGTLVRKSDVARAVKDIAFNDDYTLDDVKGMLRVLVQRLSEIGGEGSGTDTSSSY